MMNLTTPECSHSHFLYRTSCGLSANYILVAATHKRSRPLQLGTSTPDTQSSSRLQIMETILIETSNLKKENEIYVFLSVFYVFIIGGA